MEILHGFLFTHIILLFFFMNSSNVESRNHFHNPRNGAPAYAPTPVSPVSPVSPSPSYHKYPSPPPTIVSSHPSTAPASPQTAGQGTSTSPEQCIFDVMKYGAIGDGETDDTAAFRDAWKGACAVESATILVPEGYSFMITSTIFSGPCKPGLVFQVDGILMPPDGPSHWPEKDSDKQWLVFYQLDDFRLNGTGTIEGKGQQWWELPCKPHKDPNGSTLPGPCDSPTLIRFFMSSNLVVTGLRIQNSPMFHMKFDGCQGVFINKLSISSPKSSPNTDGIHFQNTKSVGIFNSQISNGDDCISIGPGCTDVTIEAVSCGLGHGISIGSLGVHNSQACVSNITVSNAIIHDSDNGVRIKTWQGGAGSVTGISFENIQMENVRNCVIIDQYYCSTKDCLNQTAAVYVNDVTFRNIKGTYDVRSPPIHFACSDTIPCTNITMSEVELLPHEGELVDDPFCWNTYGTQETITIPPIACLLDGMPELQAENYELGCA